MRIRYMDPKSHDKQIAYVSHLSHISSFMLGKTVIEKEKNERDIFDMAGSVDLHLQFVWQKVRQQCGHPFLNKTKTNVIETLDEYISNLQQFKTLMEQR